MSNTTTFVVSAAIFAVAWVIQARRRARAAERWASAVQRISARQQEAASERRWSHAEPETRSRYVVGMALDGSDGHELTLTWDEVTELAGRQSRTGQRVYVSLRDQGAVTTWVFWRGRMVDWFESD
ncbi:hypothetical protein ACFY05_40510 [Microtetraspora fusca]|uniref:DUF3592 domain-containing protein n=1 Tax=Microtetraspora fusca TaxID=1997 RepID=A0ABW6VIC9_MICFU